MRNTFERNVTLGPQTCTGNLSEEMATSIRAARNHNLEMRRHRNIQPKLQLAIVKATYISFADRQMLNLLPQGGSNESSRGVLMINYPTAQHHDRYKLFSTP